MPFRPEEGVSRAITALAAHMDGVDSHLAADMPTGTAFAGLHPLERWEPWPAITGREVRRVIADLAPDVVHLHGGILAAAIACAPARRGVPVVATFYQLLPVPRHELGIRQLGDARRSSLRPGRIAASALIGAPLARRLLARGTIAAVCTPDPRVASLLAPYGPVVAVRGGASLSPLRAQWSTQPTVAFAGRAEPGRGVEELIAAVELLHEEMPALRLRLLLLPGPAAQRWRVAYARHPQIELSIGVRPDLQAELANFQLVALPFRIPATITPPLVAAEAMAVGVPVVATRLSCITPLVRSGVNGMLTRSCSPHELAAAIRSALADRQSWERLSEGARRTIETDWSWSSAAVATQQAYDIALARDPGRSRSTTRRPPGRRAVTADAGGRSV